MCGFIGVFDRKGDLRSKEEAVFRAGKKIIHRGPDDEGAYIDDFWGVYFRRLSIIDTSPSGHQPMFSDNKDLVIVYNGEIYNYIELREDLIRRGYDFRTRSDTEVLLKSFQEFGPACVDRLRGMFAFAIWDRRRKKLFVCRDRLGIKPLYLYTDRKVFVISSEIKCILEYVGSFANIGIDEKTAFKFLSKGWADDSPQTFYQNIKAIPPSSYCEISCDDFSEKRYWSLNCKGDKRFDVDEFNNIFSETIKIHLRSDVPLAAALSGGIDSSSIVGVAASLCASAHDIHAFSVIPPETVDESYWIKKTVDYTNITHSFLDLEFNNISDVAKEVLRIHDEPYSSSSCIYQYLLRRKISQHNIKVLLVGEGGDEVFGGYRRFIYPFLHSLIQDNRIDEYNNTLNGSTDFLGITRFSIESALKNYEETLLSDKSGQENMSAYDILAADFINAHSDTARMSHNPKKIGERNYFLANLMQHLFVRDIPYVLRMEDRNSMAFNIESRVPLLDHKLLETVFSYHYSEFMKDGVNKSMLRRAMGRYLPQEVINRKSKSPRPGNNAHFIYRILKDEMLDLLHSRSIVHSNYWKADSHKLFLEDCISQNKERAEAWFRIYTFITWMDALKSSYSNMERV